MKLATKLSLSLGILTVLIAGLGIFCVAQMADINSFSDTISEKWLPRVILTEEIRVNADSYRRQQMRHIIARTQQEMTEIEEELADFAVAFNDRLERLKASLDIPEARELLNEIEVLWDDYRKESRTILDLSKRNRPDEAVPVLTGKSRQNFQIINNKLTELAGISIDGAERASRAAGEAYISSRTMVLAVVALAVVLAAALAMLIVRNTLRQLGKDPGELRSLAVEVAGGKLDIDREPEAVGVYAEILVMVERLRKNIENAHKESERAQEESRRAQEAMRQADESSREAQARRDGMLKAAVRLEEVAGIVSAASTELASQIELSEQGAAEQASRVTETATAMEEMNSTVLEVARNAGAASEVSSSTRERAEQGAQAVQELVSGIRDVQGASLALRTDMGKLAENAQAISRIMAVISDIADQTNLLALNAAIEAARAGEAGRGFAVVADEVRKLAEKTMASTTDVGNAIKAIQSSAAKSMEQVDLTANNIGKVTELAIHSGEALHEIVSMADNTADQVRGIAAASEQQSASSEEINRSIAEVNSIAGETAAAMREAAQAVSDLAHQASVLSGLIDDMKRA